MSKPVGTGWGPYLTCAALFCAALLLVLNSRLPYPLRPSPPFSDLSLSDLAVIMLLSPSSFGIPLLL